MSAEWGAGKPTYSDLEVLTHYFNMVTPTVSLAVTPFKQPKFATLAVLHFCSRSLTNEN